MVLWVPVLGQNDMRKEAGDPMDDGNHFLAAWHRESTTVTEIILYIDHQQNVAVNRF